MRIALEFYETGGVACLTDRCAFRRTCANHVSAGDYRSRGGFTPELAFVAGEVDCATADQEPLDDPDWPGVLRPLNVGLLGKGSLKAAHVECLSCHDFQI